MNSKDKISKVVVIGAIRDDENRHLIAQRIDPKIPDAHLKWDFIGGKNEFGETLEETLKREAVEEAGIEIEVEELIPLYFQKLWEHVEYLQHTLVFCFRCKALTTQASSQDHKIGSLKWVHLTDVTRYEFLPTTRQVIDSLVRK